MAKAAIRAHTENIETENGYEPIQTEKNTSDYVTGGRPFKD